MTTNAISAIHMKWDAILRFLQNSPKKNVEFISISISNMLVKFVCFVCFVALRPKSTAMVMAGRSVHLTTLFPGQA